MNEQTAWKHVQQVAPIVQSVPWTDPAYMYLERVPTTKLEQQSIEDGIRLECYQPNTSEDGIRLECYQPNTSFDCWERGRIFDSGQELKWEKVNQVFHVVYCGNNNPSELIPYQLNAAYTKQKHYYLWGTRINDDVVQDVVGKKKVGLEPFAELQIARILHYPVSSAAYRVFVRVIEFYAADGTMCYARWCGLKEEKL